MDSAGHLAGIQVLKLCQQAGLVKLGHVSVDGSEVKAKASRHKAMSRQRLTETEARLLEEVEALLAEAEAIDRAEGAPYGNGKSGGARKRGRASPREQARKPGQARSSVVSLRTFPIRNRLSPRQKAQKNSIVAADVTPDAAGTLTPKQ